MKRIVCLAFVTIFALTSQVKADPEDLLARVPESSPAVFIVDYRQLGSGISLLESTMKKGSDRSKPESGSHLKAFEKSMKKFFGDIKSHLLSFGIKPETMPYICFFETKEAPSWLYETTISEEKFIDLLETKLGQNLSKDKTPSGRTIYKADVRVFGNDLGFDIAKFKGLYFTYLERDVVVASFDQNIIVEVDKTQANLDRFPHHEDLSKKEPIIWLSYNPTEPVSTDKFKTNNIFFNKGIENFYCLALQDKDKKLISFKYKIKAKDVDSAAKILANCQFINSFLVMQTSNPAIVGKSFQFAKHGKKIMGTVKLDQDFCQLLTDLAMKMNYQKTDKSAKLSFNMVKDNDNVIKVPSTKFAEQNSPEDLIALGDQYIEMQEFHKAEKCFRSILSVNAWKKYWDVATFGRGEAFEGLKQFVKASACYERIYIMYSHNKQLSARAYLAKAQCLIEIKEYNQAVKTLDEMLSIEDLKDFPETKEAEELLEKAKASVPNETQLPSEKRGLTIRRK